MPVAGVYVDVARHYAALQAGQVVTPRSVIGSQFGNDGRITISPPRGSAMADGSPLAFGCTALVYSARDLPRLPADAAWSYRGDPGDGDQKLYELVRA
jgi:hypothetical protein